MWAIYVLQRGWVVVGKVAEEGCRTRIFPAATIRRWGTKSGLGELANGPLRETVLDRLPLGAVFHELTVVLSIPVDGDKWEGVLK